MPYTDGTGSIIIIFDKNAPSLKTPSQSLSESLGASTSRYSAADGIQAFTERNTTKTGCVLDIYDPELLVILGPELG